MRIVQLKNTSPERVFKNKDAMLRLLKRKAYFFKNDSESSFTGILMLTDKDGIEVSYANFTVEYPNRRRVNRIKYTKATKTFNHL